MKVIDKSLALILEGLPSMMQSKWSMLYNKSMMHFGPWEEYSSHCFIWVFQCACTHAETNTLIGCNVSLSLILSDHNCGTNTIALVSSPSACWLGECWNLGQDVLCMSYHVWIIELTWLVKHLSEWCYINVSLLLHIYPPFYGAPNLKIPPTTNFLHLAKCDKVWNKMWNVNINIMYKC